MDDYVLGLDRRSLPVRDLADRLLLIGDSSADEGPEISPSARDVVSAASSSRVFTKYSNHNEF